MRQGVKAPTSSPCTKKKPVAKERNMQGLDAHYSALWVANERRLDEQQQTKTYTVSVAVEGYVDIVIDATSREEAEASALDKVEVQGMLVTELTITDVEEWK
jgi:hypothetical protein